VNFYPPFNAIRAGNLADNDSPSHVL
jgi:hypothetical protein